MKASTIAVRLLIAILLLTAIGQLTSADDGQIVWASLRAGDGKLSLWTMDPDGTGAARVTSTFVQALYPTISPQGDRVAFSSQDTGTWYIYMIDLDGKNLAQFTDFSSAVPHWSADGERLIFNSDHDDEPKDTPDLWTMNADGSELEELVDSPPTADFSGRWSPDCEEVLFVSDREGNYDLYIIDTDGTNLRQLTDEPSGEWAARWSPDGESILFVSDRTGNTDLFVMNVNGSNVVQLTDYQGSDLDPAWSPDGARIVFMSDRGGKPDLWIIAADGTDPVQLTDDAALDRFPDWR